MLFYLHYMLMTSGLSGTSVLLAVYFQTYSDASQGEIGALLMTFPFVSLIIKPLFCSMADRRQAHKSYLLVALLVEIIGFIPFALIPFLPSFYTHHPRITWYTLACSCHIGLGGLGVAWSLGDCLAVNYSQKTGTPFGRMRLMGTLSWGVYGFIIGQINEIPVLPKYLPAFIILHASLIIEFIMIVLWKQSDFDMVDPIQGGTNKQKQLVGAVQNTKMQFEPNESMPSSLAGSLRLKANTTSALMNVLANQNDDDDQNNYKIAHDDNKLRDNIVVATTNNESFSNKIKCQSLESGVVCMTTTTTTPRNRNPQLVLLRMILSEDKRVLKYIVIFTAFGMLMAPMNFLFLSMEEVCREREYNFSQLAGAVLISQALIETLAFLVVPWCMLHVSKSTAISFGFAIMAAKYFFYSNWYYTAQISPYWAVLAEWSHGISYGVFCTIQADVSLEFANQSRLFIGELRKLGFLSASSSSSSSKEMIEAEERSIKMALRATMQALFSGFMDGLGSGTGALLCGIFIELYSYITLWLIFFGVACMAFAWQLLVEAKRGRWSDSHRPQAGTKAFEIMEFSRAAKGQQQEVGKNLKEAHKCQAPAQGC